MPPPLSLEGTISLPPRVTIDLTLSDDEDSVKVSLPSRTNGDENATFVPRDIPMSNTGLILSGTIFASGNSVNGGFNKEIVPQKFEIGEPSGRILATQTPRSQVIVERARSSLGEYIPQRRILEAKEHATSEPPNPAKRRKLHNAILPRPPVNAVHSPILPLQSQNGINQQKTIIQPHLRINDGSQPLDDSKLQPKSEMSRREEQQSHMRAQFDGPYTPQRPLPSVPGPTQNMVYDNAKRIQDFAENTVLKHVQTALSKYKSSRIMNKQGHIIRMAAAKLLSDPTFFVYYQSNTWTSEFEENLSTRAESIINDIVGEILRVKEQEPRNGSRIGYDSTANRDRSESRSSTEDEPVFEGVTESNHGHSIPTRIQRHYSSSPTTSYSTDPPDNVHAIENERLDGSMISSMQHSSLRKPIQRISLSKKKARTSHRFKSLYSPRLLDSIREVQSLRFATLDRSMKRPYIKFEDREDIRRGLEVLYNSSEQPHMAELQKLENSVLHVDFCSEEMEFLCIAIIQPTVGGIRPANVCIARQITALMKYQENNIERICNFAKHILKQSGKEVGRSLLRIRDVNAIRFFLEDATWGNLSTTPQLIRIESTPTRLLPPLRVSSLLKERETWGMAPHRISRCEQPFEVDFSSSLEDSITFQSEWTDCCGDISTLTWTSNQAFICGATAHSDHHNMQYNKPGNLLLGSIPRDTLKSIPDHRIVRPVIDSEQNPENALDSMRQTQDPWLYTSVVSTAHSDVSGFTFTASFDGTVKVWKVSEDGASMDLCATWQHDGRVNFVVTSEHHKRVATASDVVSRAIRVYDFDETSIAESPFDIYDCEKAMAQALEPDRRDKWAYFPSSIAWGKSLGVENFLLVGYSPRSLTEDDNAIPEEKRNSGEICLWNVANGDTILITSSTTQNVFEVIWHPTQPMFLAATSPSGVYAADTKTQIRLFAQNETGTFLHITALDCRAADINELTIMPNSRLQCYVTASCTDGNCYVWDTAQGDRPIHILGHGDSLDNPIHDIPREDGDIGVKFASWGRTTGRFYTGSSDGKVKAWDIQAPRGEAYIRTVLTISGGISIGTFSKDFSKLVIGDTTGKVHLLGINDDDLQDEPKEKLNRERAVGNRSVDRNPRSFLATLPARSAKKIPKVIVPHPEPAAPAGFEIGIELEQSAQDITRAFLEEGQLTIYPGVGAVQGPNYAETLFYRFEAHEDNDSTKPLKPDWQARQQFELRRNVPRISVKSLPAVRSSSLTNHANNTNLDFDFARLSLATQQELYRDRVDLRFDNEHTFDYEISPRQKIFRSPTKYRRSRSTAAIDGSGSLERPFEIN